LGVKRALGVRGLFFIASACFLCLV